jgi:hypothetical protein
MVELLSPIALPDALAAVSYGFRGCWSYGSRGLIALIDWGQSIYHASGGGLRFSRLLVLRVARAYRADRLGTIDLPCQRRRLTVFTAVGLTGRAGLLR